ncbi:LLM class flavin-dependent oxidoreductase [Sphingopyxis sp.]|jgi:alkanesulfonate monooxygenase SsuD/methylene tetrahydromethanopterin reductase-like flavin-dependent oxidoreductase (luciferase family)|uniref:LLM class flavin-dependent oxidoreductase n=1 Tax=Sphingopyxis sp. TaxID=1908224 RepID=UPI002DEBAD0C|nr:LLM class flavin-dependent oxidoreductase [Sphingopyxis sp.]
MKIGMQLLFAGHDGMNDRDLYKNELALALEAEPMGFDRLLPVEHHFTDYALCPDNIAVLSHIAAKTSRIELFPAAIILPWNDPLRVVEKVILLDHLSEGRVILGMGRGLARCEFDAFRINMSESRDRFDQAAEFIVGSLETGFAESDSQYYPQPRVEIRPRPLKSFKGRRYMVGMSPDSVKTAARLGLGCMKFSNAPWESAAAEIDQYRVAYREAHGEKAPPLVSADFVIVHKDLKTAEDMARKYMGAYWRSVMTHYELLGSHFEKTGKSYESYAAAKKLIAESDEEALIESYMANNLWGTPDRIVECLQQRREYIGGFDISVAFNYSNMPFDLVKDSVKLFCDEVMPKIKDWDSETPDREATEAVR